MRHLRVPSIAHPRRLDVDYADESSPSLTHIDEIQLRRLAQSVLSKSREDLIALAEANPMLVWEWIESFHKLRLAAEAEARYWSGAMAALSTAAPDARCSAAE